MRAQVHGLRPIRDCGAPVCVCMPDDNQLQHSTSQTTHGLSSDEATRRRACALPRTGPQKEERSAMAAPYISPSLRRMPSGCQHKCPTSCMSAARPGGDVAPRSPKTAAMLATRRATAAWLSDGQGLGCLERERAGRRFHRSHPPQPTERSVCSARGSSATQWRLGTLRAPKEGVNAGGPRAGAWRSAQEPASERLWPLTAPATSSGSRTAARAGPA